MSPLSRKLVVSAPPTKNEEGRSSAVLISLRVDSDSELSRHFNSTGEQNENSPTMLCHAEYQRVGTGADVQGTRAIQEKPMVSK